MTSKAVILTAVQVVGVLFAAFGGFLAELAPPGEADARFATGVGSLLTLCLLLGVKAVTRTAPAPRARRAWLAVSAVLFVGAAVSVLVYKADLERLTYGYPPEAPTAVHVAGTERTPPALDRAASHPHEPTAHTVAAFGGPTASELIWTPASIDAAARRLIVGYLAFVLCLAGTVFCLVEGALGAGAHPGPDEPDAADS